MVVYSKVVDITKVELGEAEVNEKQSRDKNETCSYSILHIVMRRKFLALNLEKRPNKIVFNLETRLSFIIFNQRLQGENELD